MMYVSRYFKPSEFRCHGSTCGCVNRPDPVMSEDLLKLLDRIREEVGKPLILTCAYRCQLHNKEVGGVPNSYHQQGIAADISAQGIGVEELAQIAERRGADGVGRYIKTGFVHVDVRGKKAHWTE